VVRHPARSRRGARILGLGLLVVAATAAACTGPEPLEPDPAPTDETTPAEGVEIPAFRLEGPGSAVLKTDRGRVTRRMRRASSRAASAAKAVLTDLYVEAFLDPENWRTASYEGAFTGFESAARREAQRREGLLTAGARAGERFDEILPKKGSIRTRILLDRHGAPALIVSVVRFRAVASGDRPMTIRSRGQFFLERVRGDWKIVSFHVTRADAPPEPA
jgi:hypothetical protein